MDFLQNWIFMAVLTPTLWAIACLLDSYLISGNIYKKPSDGAIVSCLFCLAPAVLTFNPESLTLAHLHSVQGIPLAGVAAGFAYATHLFYYFRTLHCLNDVSGAETFITLSVMIVPLFAWLLLGEVLPSRYYLAFFIAATGVIFQCLPAIRKLGTTMMINLSVSVVTVSLSMVLQAHALETHGFKSSAFAFNSTCFLVAVALTLSNRKTRKRLIKLCCRYPALLIAGEILGVLAVLSSHRATQFAPSVSIVALIECLLPLIIILISLILIGVNRYLSILPVHQQAMLATQVNGVPRKFVAIVLVTASISSLSI